MLKRLQERLDIRTVLGNGAHPSTLMSAGAEDADMLIAVTDSDEINMLACSVVFTLYRTSPRSAARARQTTSPNTRRCLNQPIPVDVIIGPEQLVTKNIEQLIANPGSLQVLDFAEGRIRLVAVKAVTGGLSSGGSRKSASICPASTPESLRSLGAAETRLSRRGRRWWSLMMKCFSLRRGNTSETSHGACVDNLATAS